MPQTSPVWEDKVDNVNLSGNSAAIWQPMNSLNETTRQYALVCGRIWNYDLRRSIGLKKYKIMVKYDTNYYKM